MTFHLDTSLPLDFLAKHRTVWCHAWQKHRRVISKVLDECGWMNAIVCGDGVHCRAEVTRWTTLCPEADRVHQQTKVAGWTTLHSGTEFISKRKQLDESRCKSRWSSSSNRNKWMNDVVSGGRRSSSANDESRCMQGRSSLANGSNWMKDVVCGDGVHPWSRGSRSLWACRFLIQIGMSVKDCFRPEYQAQRIYALVTDGTYIL